jgi:O-antigen/teichoic acid export membrane protein
VSGGKQSGESQEDLTRIISAPESSTHEDSAGGREAEVSPLFSWTFIQRNVIPWLAKGGLAILDYGLFSGSNFLLGILLARWMAPEQYGAYALALSIFILATFLYQALVLEPVSVFSATSYSDNLRGYLNSNALLHIGISVIICVALGATAVAAKVLWHSPVSAAAFAGITISAPFLLIHALGRRSFYLKLSPAPAAFGSAFYCVCVVGGVFFVYKVGWLSAFTAYLVLGAAALVGGVIMFFQLNAKLEPATAKVRLRSTWDKHWKYGKWALATCFVGWMPTYIYIPLVSKFSGLAVTAELRALMNLGGPVLQTYAALSILFLPLAARVQKTQGQRGASTLTLKLTALFVFGSFAYWGALIPLRRPLFHLLYAGKYMDASALLPLFAAETIVWSAALAPAILLRAMESPRSLFFANGAASLVTLLFGIPATRYYGLIGVIWSMVVANVFYVLVAFVILGRKLAALKTAEPGLSVPRIQSASASYPVKT